MITKELDKKLKKQFNKLSKKLGDLSLRIEIVEVKDSAATLKIGLADSLGTFIIIIKEVTVLAGDTINLQFEGKRKFKLSDFIEF